MGDALTPTREAKKKKHSGGIFLRLVGLGVWSGESYNWEKLREQNGNKKRYWSNLATKMVLQTNAHCAFINVSRTTEEIREPWNQ